MDAVEPLFDAEPIGDRGHAGRVDIGDGPDPDPRVPDQGGQVVRGGGDAAPDHSQSNLWVQGNSAATGVWIGDEGIDSEV